MRFTAVALPLLIGVAKGFTPAYTRCALLRTQKCVSRSVLLSSSTDLDAKRINKKIDLGSPKVATIETLENEKQKKVYCRCWQSDTFPLCDGSHAKHNEATGDNLGPLIISVNMGLDQKAEASVVPSPNTKAELNVKSVLQTAASTLSLIIIDIALRKYFKDARISFPSSLAGCGLLFSLLVGLYTFNNKFGDKLCDIFNPGSTLLAKFLPVFFVPSLVTLPLAQPLDSALEVCRKTPPYSVFSFMVLIWPRFFSFLFVTLCGQLAKVSFIMIAGFLFTLLTTSWSVLGVRRLGSSNAVTTSKSVSPSTPTAAPKKAFSEFTLTLLSSCAAIFAAISTSKRASISKPAQTVFMLFTTLASFVFGARLPSKVTKAVHPLVTCTSLTWLVTKLLALATSTSFIDQLRFYRTGSLASLATTGAGDILLFMLGPSVVALACQMYSRKTLMKQNIKEVATAVVGSSVGGLFGTALMVRLVNLTSSTLGLSLLSRNITSPLAMAIATILGADVSLAVSMVVISGLIGANFGASILDRAGIKDPVARGLGIGAAAHGLGTAAFANEPDAFPFSAIAMALTASMSTVLVSIPAVRKILIKIATGV